MTSKPIPRTLVKLGSNSLVVTLPKKWLTDNDLSKGDVVFLREQYNDICISNENSKALDQKEFNIDLKHQKLEVINSEIISAYLNGYDIIRIHGERLKTDSMKIKEYFHSLIGMEIIRQSGNSMVARELLDISKTSIKNNSHRIDFILRGMFEDILVCQDKNDFNHIYDRDKDVNRLAYLTFRIISKGLEFPYVAKSLDLNNKHLMDYRLFISKLESIGDNIKRIAQVLCLRGISHSEELSKLLKHFLLLYKDTIDTFHKKDRTKAHEIELLNITNIKKCKDFLHKNPKYFNAELSYLLRNISRELRDVSRIVLDFN